MTARRAERGRTEESPIPSQSRKKIRRPVELAESAMDSQLRKKNLEGVSGVSRDHT